MRTTVTIDPDARVLIEHAMRKSGASFEQVLNDAIREGLRTSKHIVSKPPDEYRQPVFDMCLPVMDLRRVNSLTSGLEDVEFIRKLRRNR